MADKTHCQSTIKKAWEDTWKWLLGTKMGWVVTVLIGGIIGGILAGVIGAIVAIVMTVGLVYIVHLIITPSRLRKEAKHQFIRDNASYTSTIIGNPLKAKWLTILDILISMIKIENEITDNMVGKRKLTIKEYNALQKNLSNKTNIPTLPYHKAVKIYLKGEYAKKIEETITKMKLQIMGDKPSENQIQFLIQTRSVVDEVGIGLSNELVNSNEYTELTIKFNEQLPNYDSTIPDWVLYLLVLPSSFNNLYLFWYALPFEAKKMLFKDTTPLLLAEFKSERELAIKQLIAYAKDSIEKM